MEPGQEDQTRLEDCQRLKARSTRRSGNSSPTRGYRNGENPARWRGHIAQILPARQRLSRGHHHKALPYNALPAFIANLREREATAALALEFAILTAARSGEVIGASWDEVDLTKAVWTVPASRIKADTCASILAYARGQP